MARYRKIDVRIWGDRRVQALSPMPPSGQGLWFYILTGPHTGIIPGLISCGPAAMAEALDWPAEAFMKAFGEALREGLLECDRKARLMWIPKAIKYNFPESPNVVKSWRVAWDEIPECDLKSQVWVQLSGSMKSKGDAYLEAFLDTCPNPSGKPSEKALTKGMANQEQEQEQEKAVPPTPLQGGLVGLGAVEPEAKPKGKPKPPRRSRKEILGPYSESVRQVANAALGEWRKKDPDGRLIDPDSSLLCINLDAILRDNPEILAADLIEAFRAYLGKSKQRYSAPQWFFGSGKPGDPAAWVREYRMILHQQQRKAEGNQPPAGE